MRYINLIIALLLSTSVMASDTTSIKGSLMLQGNYAFGNYNNYTLGSKLDLRYAVKHSLFEITTSIRYTKTGYIRQATNPGSDSFVLKENEKYNVLTYAHYWGKLKLLIFSEQEQSYLRKINIRYSVGAGLGYKFLDKKGVIFEISEVLLPEQVNYLDKSYDITSLRYSTRIKFVYCKHPFKLSCINLVQPALWNSQNVDYTDNFNIRSSTTADIFIVKNLSIGLTNDFVLQTYVTKIFPNKRSYDNTITFYLKITL